METVTVVVIFAVVMMCLCILGVNLTLKMQSDLLRGWTEWQEAVERVHQGEREAWAKERTLLIDRIQYPSIDYPTFKALNREKPPAKDKEPPKPEFV